MRKSATWMGAAALMLAIGGHAASADPVVVIDAPDVQRLRSVDAGTRTSELIGTKVYSNSNRLIGEIEDFTVARGGYLYAVVDVSQGPIENVLDLGDDHIVVPWDQLRTSEQPIRAQR